MPVSIPIDQATCNLIELLKECLALSAIAPVVGMSKRWLQMDVTPKDYAPKAVNGTCILYGG